MVKDYTLELFPLHSPLLRESLLVSFPPLSYMFKFSGSSFLTWGLSFVLFCLSTGFQGVLLWVNRAMLEGYSWEFIMQLVSHTRALTVLEVIFPWEKTPRTALPHLRKRTNGGNRHSCRNASRSTRKRNLRSKIWWFTEFCNSHYVSHFAAFFIVARTKTSAAKSYFKVVVF